MPMAMPATPTRRFLDRAFFPTSVGLRRSSRITPVTSKPTRASPRHHHHHHQQPVAAAVATPRGKSKSRTPPVKRRRTPVEATPSHNVPSSASTSTSAKATVPLTTTKASLKRKAESSEANGVACQTRRKKRKENSVVADKRRAAVANDAPIASSSKRKIDSLADVEDVDGATTTTRRKKRKENNKEPLKLTHHLHTMRAMIPNKPRERAPTNKYGTRSAASALPPVKMTDSPSPTNETASRDVNDGGSELTSVSTSVSSEYQTQALVSLHTPTSPRLEDTPIPPPIPMVESIPLPALAESAPTPFDRPMAVDHVLLNSGLSEPVPETTSPHFTATSPPDPIAIPSSNSSYVTYTNLTPSFPQGNFDIPVDIPVAGSANFTPTHAPTPSLLSELNAEFPFPTGDISLLGASGGQSYVPSLQDQVDGVPFQVHGSAGPEMTLPLGNHPNVGSVLQGTPTPLEIQEWHQKQQEQANADFVRQQAEMKKARQDQEKVWLPRVKRYYNGFFVMAGGREKVRETVQLQHRQYEARKLLAISSTTIFHSSTQSPCSSPILESPPAPLSFENVHAETYDNAEMEGDDDDDDDTEDSYEEDADADADVENRAFPSPEDVQVPGQSEFATIHSMEADVNLSAPYTPEIPKMPLQPPHTNPDSFAIHTPPSTLGTPPFLERRQDWGGHFPTMWLRHNSDTSKTGSCLFLEHRNVLRSDLDTAFVLAPTPSGHHTSSPMPLEYLLPSDPRMSDPGMTSDPGMSSDHGMSSPAPSSPSTELSYDDNDIFQQMALGMKKSDVTMANPSDLGFSFGDSGAWGAWEADSPASFPRSGLSTLDSALG